MIPPFQLHRPTTIPQAVALMSDLPASAFYRGGTELLQVMKMGLARFENLIDLKRIEALSGIMIEPDGGLRIGASTTHREIERSSTVISTYPAFAWLERRIANDRVRNVGSIGGNLCFAEPHSDPATFLLAADARLNLAGPNGERSLPVDAFIVDAFTTALEPAELLVSVRLPPPAPGTVITYRRIAFVERPAASVACRLDVDGGRITGARLAVGSVGFIPTLAENAAEILLKAASTEVAEAADAAASAVAQACDVSDGPDGSAEFLRHLVAVLTKRAVLAAAGAADGR